MIELDFAPALLPAGGSRHLASEGELELLTSYFMTSARFAVDAAVVFAGRVTLLEFTQMVLDAAVAVDSGTEAEVGPEFSADRWSVAARQGRVRIDFCRYESDTKRDVTGSVTVARTALLSASAAFVLRSLEAAERQDAAVGQNPLVREMRMRAEDLLDRHLDRSVVTLTVVDVGEDHTPGISVSAMTDRIAREIWSYGGLPAEVPAPVEVEVLAARAESGESEIAATIVAGRPTIEVIGPPESLSGEDALAEVVLAGLAELLAMYGATTHPLYLASQRA